RRSRRPQARPRRPPPPDVPAMITGLLLALVSAALINLGFLLQHRGLRAVAAGGLAGRLRRVIGNPAWLSGQALGWVGFAVQIVAVAIAPLSLVQAFAAGGLALSVPLAAGIFRQPVSGSQVVAVALIAAGLAVLPLGVSAGHDHLSAGRLIVAVVVGSVAGTALARAPAPWARAVAAGIFYGLADAAIKAVSLGWRTTGPDAVLSAWTLVAVAGTLCGFLAFQSALAHDGPVAAISVMNALAALVALICGVTAFGESLGGDAGVVVIHLAAIAIVLGAVPVLAAAQAAIAQPAEDRDARATGHVPPLAAAGRPR
ncbi:MAG: hypothetical protein WAL63_12740, partial [Solirubrobacteraceae bacterium]